ncbi:MAG: metallophosphoesterase [Bacteroidales bacterium]|nr:metallophosphoesterase [Bacteroidales bacterium]MDT8431995.1 metallophosphoesterase [Bacteroidales bacterium]
MKNLFPIMMALVFLVVLVGSNIYLSRRVAWILSAESRWWLHVIFAVVPVLMMAGLFGFSNATSALGSVLYSLSAFITGFVLFFLVSMLATELVALALKPGPVWFGVFALSLTLVVASLGTWKAFRVKLTHKDIALSELTSEVRVLHLSDIHLGHFRGASFLREIVRLGASAGPDMVVITGDLFDGRKQLRLETLAPLQEFNVPLYFVEGNHDGYSGVQEIKKLLRETGVHVLENEVVTEGPLQLVGLDHMRADNDAPGMHAMQNGKTIREVLSRLEVDPERPSVLLHHSPDGIEYASAKGIDLYLAGHTHGGQLFPVTYMNDLIFKYNRGLSSYNDTQIFVSMGAGTFGPPMRIGTKSEITMLRLVPGN